MEIMDYSNCIAELNIAYNQAKNEAGEFYNFIQRSETVTLSHEYKKQKLKELLKLKHFFEIDRNLIKQILKGKISDRLFMQFYYPYNYSGISEEIKYYKDVLDGDDKAITSRRTVTIDINDVVSNPKSYSFSNSHTNNQGSNIIDISKYLYGEKGKQDMKWYINELVKFWEEYNNSHYCLSASLTKTGPRYNIFLNGSHVLNTMQLLRNSGLSDSDLFLPEGFIDSLKHVKFETMDNTPDDIDFILLFNSIHRLISKYNITSEQFYIKDASERGKNVIGVEGKDISLSNSSELYNYASQVMQQYEHSNMNSYNSNTQQPILPRYNGRPSQGDNNLIL